MLTKRDVEKLKFSYIPSGNVKWCSCLGKQSGSLKKLNTEGPYDPAIPILDICSSKWINKMWCYPHWSITQTLEETKVPVRDTTCRNPENITLNERSQTHTATIP